MPDLLRGFDVRLDLLPDVHGPDLAAASARKPSCEPTAGMGEVVASGSGHACDRTPSPGVPGAIASVPDGMASAVLVGVNPVYGLYASMAGPIGGGLAVSTRLMVVTTTTAAALAAGSALSGFSGADRPEALFVLSALAGVMMILAGVLRWGRFTRFVSVSVLTGFLTGVAVNIVLGQLGDLLGSPQTGKPAVVKAWNVSPIQATCR